MPRWRAGACALLAGWALQGFPRCAITVRTVSQKCHVSPGRGLALAREAADEPALGPAGNRTARTLCERRVLEMPATMCKGEATVRELCAHAYIFIGGFFHSGTGALRGALSAAAPAHVSVHINTHNIQDEGKYMQTVYHFHPQFDAKLWHCAFAEGRRDEANLHPPHSRTALHRDESDALASEPRGSTLLFAQWARFWQLDKPVLVEKTPMNLLRTRYLQTLFPEVASFAIIIRHPLGCCAMMLKQIFKGLLPGLAAERVPAGGKRRGGKARGRFDAPDGERGGPRAHAANTRRGPTGRRLQPRASPPAPLDGAPSLRPAQQQLIFRRLESIVGYWADKHAQFEEDSRVLQRATVVRFEALLVDPVPGARAALRALGFALPPAGVHVRGRALNFDTWAQGLDARYTWEWHARFKAAFDLLRALPPGAPGDDSPWDAFVAAYEPAVRRYGYSLHNLTALRAPLVRLVSV